MSVANDPFFDVPRRPITLSNGVSMDLPILYMEGSTLGMWFPVNIDKAQALLPDPLVAVPNESGQAIVFVGIYEYRTTSIGPYNEIGVGIISVHPDSPIPGLFVVDLPVTTEDACLGGIEIFSYPKFVADISIHFNGAETACVALDSDGKRIMGMSGKRGVSLPTPATDMLTFSLNSSGLQQPLIQMRNPCHTSSGGGLTLRVGDSQHRMASNLRALGLEDTNPLLVMYTDKFQSKLDIEN